MDNYLSIFQGILSTKGSYLDVYLDGLNDHRKFCTQASEAGELVQHISSLLTKPETRSLGICLLASFIEDCPIDIFEKKGNLWTTLVLKSCNIHDLHREAHLIFDILEKIVKKSHLSPDIAKIFSSTYLGKIYEILGNVSLPNTIFALKCIETCTRVYPPSSGPYRGIIERFLWKNAMSIDEEIVQRCGKCLHLLQQVKGGGVLGINHKTQWKNYQVQLIGGIHSVFNDMFANCTEIYDDKIETVNLPWDTAEQFTFTYDVEPVKKAAQLYTRCHNLIKYLEIALREPFSVEKPILLKKILNIINRGLSVNCVMLEQNPITDNIALTILLPKLHVDLLDLLTTLMSILHGHLRPHSEFILGLLVDSIKWTSAKNVNRDTKIFQKLRAKVYSTLSIWCKIFQSGNRVNTIAEYLIQQILTDITPVQNEFTLQVLGGARKHMSKKARRQLHNIQNEKSNIIQTLSKDSNKQNFFSEVLDQELCVSALRCLQNILFSSNFVKPTIIKSTHIHITRICAMLCEHPPNNSTHLYSNKNCRMEAYNTLYSILMTPHVLCPPPTEIALAVLRTAAMRDPSPKVRVNCSFLLQNFEKLIHPQKESLVFTIESRDIRNMFIKHGQESLMHETVFQFSSEVENDLHEYESERADEINSDNHQTNGSEKKDPELLPHHNYGPDIQIVNIGTINEKSKECTNLISINAVDTYAETNVIESTSESDLNNCKLTGVKATQIEEISLTVSEDVRSKSPQIVLQVDDDKGSTIYEEVTNNSVYTSEPLSKKQKLNEEIVLNANGIEIDSHNIKVDEDEDTVVTDIVSQFVDELN